MTLYDANGAATSSAPVLWPFQNYIPPLTALTLISPLSAGNAIVRPLLYPVGSEIKFDIYSLMIGPVPGPADLDFPKQTTLVCFGAERVRV